MLPTAAYILKGLKGSNMTEMNIFGCMGTVESWPEPLIDHLR